MDLNGKNNGNVGEAPTTVSKNSNEDEGVVEQNPKIGEGNEEIEKMEDPNVNKDTHATMPDTDENCKEIIEASDNEEKFSTTGAVDHDESPRNIEDDKALTYNLTDFERKTLVELRSMVDHAIRKNKILKNAKQNEEDEDHPKREQEDEEDKSSSADIDISLWGIPLMPSKGDIRTDTVLLKFLTAREFKANEAFEMIKNTLKWRKENQIDSIMDEEFGDEFKSFCCMKGTSIDGHPVCYNVYGVFMSEEMYNQTFGTEAGRHRFLRWRLHLLEKEIRKLDFSPGGISTMIQVNDLKNVPGMSRKDHRVVTKQALDILQANYPEFADKNIFVNVPFWYYTFSTILYSFLTQRAKNKFVISRPASVTETLVKYIAVEDIPVNYGGLLRDDNLDFSRQDHASEVIIKAGTTGTIEIPISVVGDTMTWEVTIVGWDVNYKEEFVPSDEKSYTVIVKREQKIGWKEEPARNAYRNNEPGKVVISIENGMFKKKRVFYRYKLKNIFS